MAGHEAGGPPRARAAEALSPGDLLNLAHCHRLCLPDTASSRAGVEILGAMYRGLAGDRRAHVVWRAGSEPTPHLGGFASGTCDLRATEAALRKRLPWRAVVALGLRSLASPNHLLARRRWEKIIPAAPAGYILTLGTARALVAGSPAPGGAELMTELEAWFSSNGCGESWVDTEATNTRAVAFYLKRGYACVSRDFGQVLLSKRLR